MARTTRSVDGVIVIDKPAGITSMDVVRRVKRAGGLRKVGHGGTLDPVATGVIPICLGQATRMMEYLVDGRKEYRGLIELGVQTDTYDSAGQVTARSDPSGITAEQIEAALGGFRGEIDQVPPMYSALKREGRRLYDLARSGVEVALDPRRVLVEDIALESYEPPLASVFVRCGRGFYMRSLAHDLGAALGVGGNLKGLARLRSGPFGLEEALSLERAEELLAAGGLEDILHAPDAVLMNLPAVVLGQAAARIVRQGQPIPAGARIPPARRGQRARAYGTGGEFIALLVFDGSGGQWRPEKVFDISYLEDGGEKRGRGAPG